MSFDDNDVPLSVLGKSLKCGKDDEFGKIVNQKIGNTDVTLYLTCPQCGNKWSNTYNFGQFIRMANMALIDKPQLIEFQKKMVVNKGKYIKLDEGLEGAYYVEPKA